MMKLAARLLNALSPNLARQAAALAQAQQQIRIAEALFDSHLLVLVTDARRVIQRVNQAFIEHMGYSAEELIGNTPWMLRSGHHDAAFYSAMLRSIQNTGRWQGEIWDRRKDGEVIPKWMTITAVADEQGAITHFVACYTDLTARKQAEEQAQKLALYDVLTGLPNRALLIEMLEHSQHSCVTYHQYGALLLLDLDQFKTLNDSQGFAQGDALLQATAQRLRQHLGEAVSIARLGGDEFAVLLTDLGQDAQTAARHAEQQGQMLRQALAEPYELGDLHYSGSASLGVTLFTCTGSAPSELIKQAELAMYQAKQAGRNALRFFDHALEEAIAEQARLLQELRPALHGGQFALYYQLQISADQQLLGAEVLLRWLHPERGMVSPAHFIALAEESGQIIELGDWVLEQACRQLAAWQHDPLFCSLVLAVNVSARQFSQDDFASKVLAFLERSGAQPKQLKLELTESLLVGDTGSLIEKMHALKAFGISLSLDDFGTGYSSLSYLKQLPLDQLKVDQSFVRELLTDRSAAAIAEAVIKLGSSLNLAVIAEGVEELAQQQFLAKLGCLHYQGYLFSKPLPLPEFEALVRRLSPD